VAAGPRKGRNTNQLQFLLKNVIRVLWRHHYAWPFLKPVDPVALRIPVSWQYDLTSVCVCLIRTNITCYLFWIIAGLFLHHQEANGHVHHQEEAWTKCLPLCPGMYWRLQADVHQLLHIQQANWCQYYWLLFMEKNNVLFLFPLGCYHDGEEPGDCVWSEIAANAKGSKLRQTWHISNL